jgi:hypothetical protein
MSLDERIKNQIDNINNNKEILKNSYEKYHELMLLKFKDEFPFIDENIDNWFYFHRYLADFDYRTGAYNKYTLKGYYALKKGKNIYENDNCIDPSLYDKYVTNRGCINCKLILCTNISYKVTQYEKYFLLTYEDKIGIIVNKDYFLFNYDD